MAVQGFGGPARGPIDPALIQRAIQRRRRGGPAGGKPAFPPSSVNVPPGQWRLQQGLIGSPQAQAQARKRQFPPMKGA